MSRPTNSPSPKSIVETAWEQNLSAGLLDIQYSELGDLLFIDAKRFRRKTVDLHFTKLVCLCKGSLVSS
jgi:hypothetical protein